MTPVRFVRSSSTSIMLWTSLVLAQPALAQQNTGAADTLSVFVGPDGSKQPQDLGINANMGIRFGVNFAAPLSHAHGVGVQIGVGQNVSDSAVHVLDQIDRTSSRKQTFVTVGVFQRTSNRLSWGVAYDFLGQQYYDDVRMGQVRGRVGIDVRSSDLVGVALRAAVKGSDAVAAGMPVRLDPITQVDLFHRHTWDNHVQTTVSLGVANGHDNVVFVFPANERDSPAFAYGAEISVPLSQRFAMLGSSNLILPAATGTVDAYLGVVWFPGKGAMRAPTHRLAPLFNVANNPEFAVNLKRR